MKTTIKVISMFRADSYEQNYERAIERGANFDTTCICCGRKLNEKTKREIQGLAPGYFVDTELRSIPERPGQEPMGWYSVGPECYKEIRRRLREESQTVVVDM